MNIEENMGYFEGLNIAEYELKRVCDLYNRTNFQNLYELLKLTKE